MMLWCCPYLSLLVKSLILRLAMCFLWCCGGHFFEPTAQWQKSLAVLPLQVSIAFLSRVNHLIRVALCHGFFSLLLPLMRIRLFSFSFYSLHVHLSRRALPAPYGVLHQWLLVAAGLRIMLLSWLYIQDLGLLLALALGCFQLLWSKVAAVASKFRARILESCVCACLERKALLCTLLNTVLPDSL